VVEEDLGEQPVCRVANDDRGVLQLIDDAPYVLDDGGDGQCLYGRGVLAQRLDLDLEAWIGRG
jgi:hypothetical protein